MVWHFIIDVTFDEVAGVGSDAQLGRLIFGRFEADHAVGLFVQKPEFQ